MNRARSRVGVTARFIAAAALGLTGLAVAVAPAAQAATITGPTSAAVSTTVTYTVSGVSEGTYELVDTTGQIWAQTSVGVGASQAFLTFTTPAYTSTLSMNPLFAADGQNFTQFANQIVLSVGSITTTTAISAPNNAKVGTSTQITVTVSASGGSAYSPPGQVVVKDATGATITTMGLTSGPGAGQSYAYWRWTPQTPGTYYFTATYLPAGGSQAAGSTSAQDAIVATPSGNPISLTAPPNMAVGTPVTLTATVFPTNTQGSVGFTVNGAPISASIPLVNGVANFTWTPNVAGQVTLGASYTTNAGGSGSTTDVVTIAGAPAQGDRITLVQPGWGPWTPNGTYTLGNGSSFTFQASTLSGAPVTLSETGPCVVSGLTITVNQGAGACNVVASSPGANGYAAVKSGYTVNLIPGVQQATISAPPSGSYKVGRVLVLEAPGQQDTSAGQNINWKVKKGGKAVCKLLYPDNGSVTVRIAKRGSCTIVGSAPAVPGQWQQFQTARNYTGR